VTRLIHDAMTNSGCLVLTAAGDADECYVRHDKGHAHECLSLCPKCKLRKLHPEDGCDGCRKIVAMVAECLANPDSQEHRDTLLAMTTRKPPLNHSKRYPKRKLTLEEKQAKAAKARAAKGRTA
jgi:hypothetical protein